MQTNVKPLRYCQVLAFPFYSRREKRLRFWLRLALTAGMAVLLPLVINPALTRLTPATAEGVLLPYVSQLLAVIIVIPVSRVLFDRVRPECAWGRLGLEVCAGFIIAGLAIGAVFVLALATGWISIARSVFAAGADLAVLKGAATSLAVYVCVGIYEELATRGYLLPNLAQACARFLPAPWAVTAGWALSSALFGLAHAWNPHASILSTLLIIVAGLMLGLGTVLTGRLGLAIGIHIGWNWFLGAVFGFAVSGVRISDGSLFSIRLTGPEIWTGGAFGPEAGLLGGIAILLAAGLVILWVRSREHTLRLALTMLDLNGLWKI